MTDEGIRIIPYFSPRSETTTYLIFQQGAHEAALVDPTPLDHELFTLIMQNELTITHVFVTHPEPYMRRAMSTLSRVYDFLIVCGEENLYAFENRCIVGEGTVEIGTLQVQTIPALPHSRSSFFFRLQEVVFTGSIIHAGTIGETGSAYAEALLIATVKDYIFTMDRHTLLLPSVGPPSTVAAERDLSPYYREGGLSREG
ncbi:MAG: hypothetical protein PF508_00790 [Spirochaeta sp.]|nr:hypothetical protein [Spirochaeta sp.]